MAAISLVMPGIGVWPALRSVRPVSADLNTVFSAEPNPGPITHTRISHGVLPAVAQTQGYALAFRVGAAVLAVAGVLVLVLLEHVTARPRIAAAEATPEQAPAPPSLTPGRG